MPDTSNRTFVCSVLFLDIVEYSKKPVAEQLSLKQRFNSLLVDAMRHVATVDRIVLDTGDGAAVSFLGNPEDCLFAAMSLRDGIAAESPDLVPPLRVRIGINLGPVRLIKDINGQLNIIGDGINVAQRVMSFAEPGSILVSRSYYEVVSCLSKDFEHLFRYEGTHTDKHVREHSVYTIAPEMRSLPRPPEASTTVPKLSVNATATGGRASHFAAPGGRKTLWLAAGVASMLIVGALWWRLDRKPEPTTKIEPAAYAAPVVATPSKSPAEKKKMAEPKVPVVLSILPWGEVYVDGQKKGVSPPLKSIALAPGPHRVEVRNTTFAPYATTVDVAAGEKITIKHKF